MICDCGNVAGDSAGNCGWLSELEMDGGNGWNLNSNLSSG